MHTQKVRFQIEQHKIFPATAVALLGDFNHWRLEKAIFLQKAPNGTFFIDIDLPEGEYQYKFYLNDGRWMNDDASKAKNIFGSENSCISVKNVVDPKVPTAFTAQIDKHATENLERPNKGFIEQKEPIKNGSIATQFQKQFHDLKKLHGIDEQIEALLYKADLRTYGALGKISVKKLKEILKKGGKQFKDVDPATWPKQGKLASLGKWDDLHQQYKK